MKRTTKCIYCGKTIQVDIPENAIPKGYSKDNDCLGCSCNQCVPENSAARDGINESIYTEV